MRCWEFSFGHVRRGLTLTADEKLGSIVFIGESGRGRTFERISLDRHAPAEISGDRVMSAALREIKPQEGGKQFRPFWVLAAPQGASEATLVRVNTAGAYRRYAGGKWATHRGQPETVLVAHGAHGDAGRIPGGWADGFVILRPGDVLNVTVEGGGNLAEDEFALFLGESGEPRSMAWREWEAFDAVRSVAPEFVFGRMPAFTFDPARGETRPGIEVGKSAAGSAVVLGETGRGRTEVAVPLVGFTAERVEAAAVIKLGDVFGLAESERSESGGIILRIAGFEPARNVFRSAEPLRGNPLLLGRGSVASGMAGRVGRVDDTLWALRPGDILKYGVPGGEGRRVLENRGGRIVPTPFEEWEVADAAKNPEAYVAKGKAPWGCVPAEWVGSVVKVIARVREYDDRARESRERLVETVEGELVSLAPFTVNRAAEFGDRLDAVVANAVWVVRGGEPRRMSEEELADRADAKAKAAHVREAAAILAAPHFACFPDSVREGIECVSVHRSRFGSDRIEFTLMRTDEIRGWCASAEAVLAEAREAEAAAIELHGRRSQGEVLVDFAGHFRRMGASGNCDLWVVRPDGSLREPDEVEYRKRYTSEGHKRWRLVAAEELALRWTRGASPAFEVAKRPAGGCTAGQLAAVRKIEEEVGELEGAAGLDSEINRRNAARVAEIRSAVAPHLKQIPEFGYYDVAGSNGVTLDAEACDLRANLAAPFSERCDGRDAQLLRGVAAAEGVVEFLAYEKYGGMNYAMRWRPLREDEAVASAPASAASAESKSASSEKATPEMLEALRRRFSGK